MIIANEKPIKIIGYPESTMTHEFVNEIIKTNAVDIITPSEFLSIDNKDDYQYIISVTFDLQERRSVIDAVDTLNLDLITVISDTSLVGTTPAPYICPGTFIFPFCNISLGSSIGRHCIVGSYGLVGHYSHLGNNCVLRPGVMLTGKSRVGNNCVVNTRATITNNVTIADDVEIIAFANIVKNIEYAGQYLTKTVKI